MRTRIAPSPTGDPHVGTAYVALFNYALAKKHGGQFLLRIEDTDRQRSHPQSERMIFEALHWLGLSWDEGPDVGGPHGPYRQTERAAFYAAAAERLLAEGKAYRCVCSPDELDARRKEAEAKRIPFRYDGRCRDADIPVDRPAAVRLRLPREGEVVVEDALRGRIPFPNRDLDDWILVRTSGGPTYNFCVVVDDVSMEITHVIRGDDHLANTPKQVHLFAALGYPLPIFAHVPMILGPDRTRLSKRHGATSVLAFRDAGILPDALVNTLARLSWSAGDQELFTREELVSKFTMDAIGASAAVFNPEKLHWVNATKMKALSPEELGDVAEPFLAAKGWSAPDRVWRARLAASMRERAKTLVELAEAAAFAFEDPEPDPKAAAKWLKPEVAPPLADLLARLEAAAWEEPPLKAAFEATLAESGLKMGTLAQAVRVAVTGGDVSPPIYDVLLLLGRERSLARIRRAIEGLAAARGRGEA